MKFSRIIGKVDPKLVEQAEAKLSQTFLELGTKYSNQHIGSYLGGDPFIFTLLFPCKHICTLNMPTAATDGKCYYWNPKFVMKLSQIGLRIVAAHEAWHSIYMHPQRRGSRLPKLWNIAVDYIVNGACMDDFKARGKDPRELFTKNLGKFMTLNEFADLIKDPFNPKKDLADTVLNSKDNSPEVSLPAPDDDRELTEEEIKELERREKKEMCFYADPDLSDEMKSPEAIYNFLYGLLPKCPKCGSVGKYKKPQPKQNEKDSKGDKDGKGSKGGKGKGDKSKDKGKGKGKDKGDKGDQPGDQGDQGDKHDHGDGSPCGCPDYGNQPGDGEGDQDGDGQGQKPGKGKGGNQPGDDSCGGCDTCGDDMDIFDIGGTLDDHMDSQESEEKMAKRISDAMHSARQMAGSIPAGLEDELGRLTAPKMTWQDVIRSRIVRSRVGNSRNDYNRFKVKQMHAGLLVPKRVSHIVNFGCLLDTSGSMSKEDMAFGISQLASLDERSEGSITPVDCAIYWESTTKIKKCSLEELSKVKVTGRGGTFFAPYFDEYEKNIGKCDFLIVITDAYLMDTDISAMQDPGIPVFWLVTSKNESFNAPFGKVYQLRD
jgi:predicted metal-dependent peptidase